MSLRKINRVLRAFGLVLFVVELDDDQEAEQRGRTHFSLAWIGLHGSRRRNAWDARWMVEAVPHIPELRPTDA